MERPAINANLAVSQLMQMAGELQLCSVEPDSWHCSWDACMGLHSCFVNLIPHVNNPLGSTSVAIDTSHDTSMPHTTTASFHFIRPEARWSHEKPYSFFSEPQQAIARSNLSLQRESAICVQNVRELAEQPSITKHGFTLIQVDTPGLSLEQLDEPTTVASLLLPKYAEAVKTATGASRVQFFDYTIRRRHRDFPKHSGESYEYLQPTSIPHIDCTQADAAEFLTTLNKEEAAHLGEQHWQCFNVWAPLTGPVRDYPLALLDARTLDLELDVESADIIYPDVVRETYYVYNRSHHRWYYAADQMPHECWLFIQATSGHKMLPGVAHSSFEHAFDAGQDVPRESIECRGFMFHD